MKTTNLESIKQNLIEENSIVINNKEYSKDGYVPSEAYLARLKEYKKPFDSVSLYQASILKKEVLSTYDLLIKEGKEIIKTVYGVGMHLKDAIIMDLKRRMQSIVFESKVYITQMIQDLRNYLGWSFYTVNNGVIMQPENIYQAWKMMGNTPMRELKTVLFNKS